MFVYFRRRHYLGEYVYFRRCLYLGEYVYFRRRHYLGEYGKQKSTGFLASSYFLWFKHKFHAPVHLDILFFSQYFFNVQLSFENRHYPLVTQKKQFHQNIKMPIDRRLCKESEYVSCIGSGHRMPLVMHEKIVLNFQFAECPFGGGKSR